MLVISLQEYVSRLSNIHEFDVTLIQSPVSVPIEGWLLVGVLYALNGTCQDDTWSAGREKSEKTV